jgi:hypothetical protein
MASNITDSPSNECRHNDDADPLHQAGVGVEESYLEAVAFLA